MEALALRHTAHVNHLAFGEHGHGNNVANLVSRNVTQAHFAEHTRGEIETGLLGVTEFTGGRVLGLLVREAKLDGVIAVGRHRLDLDHSAGSSLNHGDGDQDVLRVIDLRHADLFAEYF